MISFEQKTCTELINDLSDKLKKLRKRKKLSQQELASRSGVSLGSLKRFEQTGEISLKSFAKLAIALDVENELDGLFNEVKYQSIAEVLNDKN